MFKLAKPFFLGTEKKCQNICFDLFLSFNTAVLPALSVQKSGGWTPISYFDTYNILQVHFIYLLVCLFFYFIFYFFTFNKQGEARREIWRVSHVQKCLYNRDVWEPFSNVNLESCIIAWFLWLWLEEKHHVSNSELFLCWEHWRGPSATSSLLSSQSLFPPTTVIVAFVFPVWHKEGTKE